MSNNVDRRVVEMEFDNARFEQKAGETISTLDKLKKSLDFSNAEKSFDSIDKAAKNVDLTRLEEGISSIEQRFSTMGIVGMTVLQNLTNTVTNTVKKMMSQIWTGGITRAMNIEQARFQIEGLGKSFEDLKDNINYAVKGTAYGFDEAAKAAAMLTASGIKAGSEMQGSLRAISGLAAMTNSSYTDISDIFTTVAGNSKLMTQQLRQFSFRGMNVSASLAKAFNEVNSGSADSAKHIEELTKKLTGGAEATKEQREEIQKLVKAVAKVTNGAKVTEETINEMVSKGEIDFKTFSLAMDYAFGAHATEADKTFTGAMSNVKAALARIGAAFVQPVITMTSFNDKIWNLVDVMVAVKNIFNAVEKAVTSSRLFTQFDEAGKQIGEIGIYNKYLEKFTKSLTLFLRKFVEVDENNRALGFSKEGFFYFITKQATRAFSGVTALLGLLGKVVKNVVSAFSPLGKLVKSVFNDAMTFFALLGEAIAYLSNSIGGSKAFKNFFSDLSSGIKLLSSILGRVSFLLFAIPKSLAMLIPPVAKVIGQNDKLKSSFSSLASILSIIKSILSKFFHFIDDGLRIIGERWVDFDEGVLQTWSDSIMNRIAPNASKVIETFKGIGAIGDNIGKTVTSFSKFGKAIGDIAKNIDLLGINAKSKLSNVSIFGKSISDIAPSIKILGDGFKTGVPIFSNFSDKAKILSEHIGEFSNRFKNSASSINIFGKSLGDNINSIKTFGNRFEKNLSSLSVGSKILDAIRSKFSSTKKSVDGFAESLSNLTKKQNVFTAFKSKTVLVLNAIKDALRGIISAFKETFTGFNSVEKESKNTVNKILNIFNAGLILGVVAMLKEFANTITLKGRNWAGLTKIESLLANLKDVLVGYQRELKANTLMGIAKAVAIMAGSLLVLSLIDPKRLLSSLYALYSIMILLMITMSLLLRTIIPIGKSTEKFDWSFLTGFGDVIRLNSISNAVIKFSAAVFIMAAALKMLASIPTEDIFKGLLAITVLIGSLMMSAKVMASTDKMWVKGGLALIGLSVAINILAIAVKQFSKMDWVGLSKGLSSIGFLLLGLAAFSKLTAESGFTVKSAAAILLISASMIVFSKAIKSFEKMDPITIAKGLTTITIALLMFASIMWMLRATENSVKVAAGIVLMSYSISIIGESLKRLGDLDLKSIGKALLALGGALLLMSAALFIVDGSASGAIAMAIFAASLIILAKAFKALGGMKMKSIGKALAALAGGLIIMSGAMLLMDGNVAGAASLVAMAMALKILAPALVMLGKMSLKEIGKSLLEVAGAMIVMGGIAALLSPLSPLILAFSLAITMLGVALLAAGAGVYFFTAAMGILAGMTGGTINMVKEQIISLSTAIPMIMQNIASGVVEFIQGIADKAPSVANAAFELIFALVDVLREHIFDIAVVGADIIAGFINGVASKLSDVINAGFNLIVRFIDGMADAIVENSPRLIAALANLMWSLAYMMVEILRSLLSNIPIVGDQIDKALSDVESSIQDNMDANKAVIYGEDYMEGIADGVSAGTSAVEEAVASAGQKSGEGFASTIDAAKSQAEDAAKNLKDSAKTEVDKAETDFLIAGDYASQGFIKGIKGRIQEAWQAGSDLAGAADRGTRYKAEIQSPSKVFEELGRYVAMGFANGITSLNSKVRSASESMAGASIETMQNAIKSINDIASSDWSQPTIRPVLDLSEIQNGGGRISAMLNGASLSLGSSVLNARKINAELDKSAAITMANEENLIASQNKVVTALDDLTRLTEQNKLDIDQIYDAVRIGASNATVSVPLNGRELSRGLRDMGVAFK